jgi:hypothetical protein
MDLLYLIYHQHRVAETNTPPEESRPRAEDALVGTAPAGDYSAGRTDSMVFGEGQEVACRDGKLVQILDKGAGLSFYHPVIFTEGNPLHLLDIFAFLQRSCQLNYCPLSLPDDYQIDPAGSKESFLDGEAGMWAT